MSSGNHAIMHVDGYRKHFGKMSIAPKTLFTNLRNEGWVITEKIHIESDGPSTFAFIYMQRHGISYQKLIYRTCMGGFGIVIAYLPK